MSENTIDKNSLLRGLGLIAAISIIIGNVIGTGVFLKTRIMSCNLGESPWFSTPTWVIIVWVLAGALSLAGALTYAELTAMKPQAGGEYVFLRDAYGRVWSFLYGWMQMFIAKTGSQAAVAVAFAIFLNDFLGGELKKVLIFKEFAFYELTTQWTFPFLSYEAATYSYELTTLQIVAVMMIIIITTINCASVSVSGQVATYLTVLKILLVLFIGIGAYLLADGNFANYGLDNVGGACEKVSAATRYGVEGTSFAAGFGAAMLGALWGYDGWNNLSLVAGEVKNPQRNIPLALIGGTIAIIFLYVFVNFAYFYVLTPTEIASVSADSSVAREVAAKFLGVGAIVLMSAGLMASSVGTLHTSVLTGARVPYAMAQDGVMFKSLGRLSATRVPIGALIVQGIWACLLAVSGSFDTLTDFVIFGSWIFYGVTTATIFVFRRKYPDLPRPYKAFGYPVVPILFLLSTGWLLYRTIIDAPGKAFVGLFLILSGLPIYYYLTKRYAAEQFENQGTAER